MHSASTPTVPLQRTSGRAMFQRRVITSVLMLSLLLQQGCYTAVPVAGATTLPAEEVIVSVNDRGRILVGERLGPLLDRVVGRVVRADSMQVELAVRTSYDVRGNLAHWGGDRFTIPREGIGSIVVKKVDKRRSAIVMGAVVAGAIALFVAVKGLKTKNSPGGDNPGGQPPI